MLIAKLFKVFATNGGGLINLVLQRMIARKCLTVIFLFSPRINYQKTNYKDNGRCRIGKYFFQQHKVLLVFSGV